MRWRAALISLALLYLGLHTPGIGPDAMRHPPMAAADDLKRG